MGRFIFEALIYIAAPAAGVTFLFAAARWLWTASEKTRLSAQVDVRPLQAELEGARTRIDELERRLEHVEDKTVFVERLLEKPADQR